MGTDRTKPKRRHAGFTLLEMVIVLFVAALVALMALPPLLKAQENYHLDSVARQLAARLQTARIDSINVHTRHRVRWVNNSTYVVERDISGSWVPRETVLMRNGFALAASATPVFVDRGTASPTATFTITNANALTRQVIVTTSGRVRVQ